ncbi:MAG: OsmC family protein [Rhizomicrobium sp.]
MGSNTSIGETILVAETGLGRFQVEARVGNAAFLIDEPAASGGLGSGPNPYDLLSAALGACKTMTIRLYANRKGWPLERVQVAVRHSRADLQARDVFEADVTLGGALDEAQRARLLEIAERCPVHMTLTRGADVRTVLLPAPASLAKPEEGPAHVQCMEEACAD